MKKYKFISRIRGIYRIDEYKEVEATSLMEAESKIEEKYRYHFQIFTISK